MMRVIVEKITSSITHYSGASKAVTVQGVRNNGAFFEHKTSKNPQSPAK
jgi:hypothetical protein